MGTKKIPQKNDLVLVVVNNITNHGIYCDLKEYDGITAYCHISEIAGTFIRNIRNFVKVGQNTVAKVLRVSPENNQVDISLKRVNDSHKRDKIQEYKRRHICDPTTKNFARPREHMLREQRQCDAI